MTTMLDFSDNSKYNAYIQSRNNEEEINEIGSKIKCLTESAATSTTEKTNLSNIESKREKLDSLKKEFNRKTRQHRKELDFYHNNDGLPNL